MRRLPLPFALAASAVLAWSTPASATWVGLADGQYQVSLQCTNSLTLDCAQPIVGTITVQGNGLSQMDVTIAGLDFTGNPGDNVIGDANGSAEGSFIGNPVGAALGLRQVTDGSVLGFGTGQRFWVYCSDLPNSQSCLADTAGLWTATPIGTVGEPPALAAAALALAAAFSAPRRRRRAAAPASPTAA